MKFIRNILTILLGVIFLISASGVLIYHTHCACTGLDKVSLYIPSPDECYDHLPDIDLHHVIDFSTSMEMECHADTPHDDDECNCNKPEILYLKINDQLQEEIVRIEKPESIDIISDFITLIFTDKISVVNNLQSIRSRDNPKPLIITAIDFLISIQKLKIPTLS